MSPAPVAGSDREYEALLSSVQTWMPVCGLRAPTIQVHKCPEPHHGRLHATSKLTAGFGAEYPK